MNLRRFHCFDIHFSNESVEGINIVVELDQVAKSFVIKGEWDNSIMWHAPFRNKQWKLLFIDSYILYYIC